MPDETIEAMVLTRLRGGGLIGSQRLIVATPRRLLLVEKGLLTGRERVEDIAWSLLFVPSSGLAGVGEVVSLEYAWLRRVELAEPLTVVVDADGREVRWEGVLPEERALSLVEVASARLARF